MEYKVLLIGSSSVGKTTWLNKIINNKYLEQHIPSEKK